MCFLFVTACERPFEPLAPSDLAFSIYGHLDAAADTQWVRVMPLRESREMPADPIDAVVTLEELETGTTVTMSDSLFRYQPVFLDGELYAHNFSTAMPMVPGRHYRLTATRSDGAAASASVLIPTFEDPTMTISHRPGLGTPVYGTISGTRHLGMVLGREDIPVDCRISFATHQQFLPVFRPAASDSDDHGVQLSWLLGVDRPPYVPGHPVYGEPSPIPSLPNYCNLGPKRVLAVASGEPWASGTVIRIRERTPPDAVNNIEGRGLGFLAGVNTHVFPYAECVPIDRTQPCTITFSARSATIVGLVRNSCNEQPLDSVVVRLTSPPNNAIRADTSDISGIVRFDGIDPEVSYVLELERLLTPPANARNFFPAEASAGPIVPSVVDTVTVDLAHRWNCIDRGRL